MPKCREHHLSALKYSTFFSTRNLNQKVYFKVLKRYSGYTMEGKEVLIYDLEKQCKFHIRSFYWYNKKITYTQTLRNKTVRQYCLIVLKKNTYSILKCNTDSSSMHFETPVHFFCFFNSLLTQLGKRLR